jgi:hypothetical protein
MRHAITGYLWRLRGGRVLAMQDVRDALRRMMDISRCLNIPAMWRPRV